MKQNVIKYHMMSGEQYYLQRFLNEIAEVTINPIYAVKFQESTEELVLELTTSCLRLESGVLIHPSEILEVESVPYTATRALGSYEVL